RLLAQQGAQAVGELDLAAAPGGRLLEVAEDVGRQDVAADDRQVGGGLLRDRLLHQVGDLVEAVAGRARGHDAVVGGALAADTLDADDRGPVLHVDVDQLPHHGDAGVDDVVPQEDG